MLLDLDVFWKILNDRRIVLGNGIPSLFNTTFGWMIDRSVEINTSDKPNDNLVFAT